MEIAFLDAEFVFSAAFLITIVVVILLQVFLFSGPGQLNNWYCLSVGRSVGLSQLTIRA